MTRLNWSTPLYRGWVIVLATSEHTSWAPRALELKGHDSWRIARRRDSLRLPWPFVRIQRSM